jgi:uncharacterized damage-inducible protein DinB
VDKLKYPIGRFQRPAQLGPAERERAVLAIEETPQRLRAAVLGLTEEQLDTPYRPDGWTVRQVVHHMPDSHFNAYTRCKLALTEENPTIRGYQEARWAELPEAKHGPAEISLSLLDALHARWVLVLRGMHADDWKRPFIHPDSGAQTIDSLVALYAWHGRHHVAQINGLRQRERWL